jgi:hypothetical protein
MNNCSICSFSGSNVGYSRIWQNLHQKYQLHVGKELLRCYLHCQDPSAVYSPLRRRLQRRTYVSNAPNECWHLDGYYILKKYGLAVHGCVDGYSRRIIWLRCSASNNNPYVIGSFYLDAVEKLMLCPNKLRSDRRSENSVVAALQSCFTRNWNSYVFGSSTNQRIGSFWAVLRRQFSK